MKLVGYFEKKKKRKILGRFIDFKFLGENQQNFPRVLKILILVRCIFDTGFDPNCGASFLSDYVCIFVS